MDHGDAMTGKGNHYHCIIETPDGNLSQGMQWLGQAPQGRIRVLRDRPLPSRLPPGSAGFEQRGSEGSEAVKCIYTALFTSAASLFKFISAD
jgi:hypothetical protein